MSKFIIVYFIALVAATTYGATLEKRQLKTTDISKENCINSIHQTYDDMLQLYKDFYSNSNKADYLPGLDELSRVGLKAINSLIKKVNEMDSIGEVRPATIFLGHVVRCNEAITLELSQIAKDLLHLNKKKE